MSASVVVVDYGVGNLLSVTRALEEVGGQPVLSRDPRVIAAADRLVLPGVGAFGDGMTGLCGYGLQDAVRSFAAAGRPFLGICLGMQMMLETSEEFGAHEGLGLIPGHVVRVPSTGLDNRPHRIPHIGWNGLLPAEATGEGAWAGTILDGIKPGEAVYFVHSFMAEPTDPGHRLADCDYDGRRLAALVQHGVIYGCQFHPEKSGPVGLRILSNFLSL